MPYILPSSSFPFDVFGLDLGAGYLAQPGGSTITINRSGFDNLERRFIVNTEVIETDSFVPGTQDYEFSQMLAEKIVDTRAIGGPWSEVYVGYLGIIDSNKIPLVGTDTDTRRTSFTLVWTVPDVGAFTIVNYAFDVPEMTVQKVYVQVARPDFNAPGLVVDGWILAGFDGDPPTAQYQHTVGGLPPIANVPRPAFATTETLLHVPHGTIIPYMWFWQLKKRSVRIAGEEGSGTELYEVTDSWKRIIYMVGEPVSNAAAQ